MNAEAIFRARLQQARLRQLAEDLLPDAERDAAPRKLDKYRIGQLAQRRLNVLEVADVLEEFIERHNASEKPPDAPPQTRAERDLIKDIARRLVLPKA